ncbi:MULTISPECIES: methyltransferase domain-containing protein [Streptomyces]|uniref:methyltransferase domain-containing protein n=1 Tax=Streptomyces TaxID=1883 RepID=UPI00186B0E6F|nr:MULTISPECIES: methyltransferase domain-containing protein [Streptomyces]
MNTIAAEGSAMEQLLARVAEFLGRPVSPEWENAFRAVPRHRFLLDRIWLRDGHGGYDICDRAAQPTRWWAAAHADAPVVTHVLTEADGTRCPLSSASAPGTVVAMLEALDVRPGTRVLEIGTGTGWNAGLLASRAGDAEVVTVELDRELAERARATLAAVGRSPRVVHANGAEGWPPGAPYERVVATCSVRRVPRPWLDQLAPGGRLVTPWASAWCAYGTAVVERDERGIVMGRWRPGGSYMPLRAPGARPEERPPDTHPERAPAEPTELSPWAVAGEDYQAQFVMGLLVPGVWHAWEAGNQRAGTHATLWVRAENDPSAALVEVAAGTGHTTVRQSGPRRLWDEISAAYGWWHAAGSPDMPRFGFTCGGDGTTTAWLDTPERQLPEPTTR